MPLDDLSSQVRRWMFDVALPFWAEHAVDRTHGGAVESLTLEEAPAPIKGFRRLRVACRQLYVFSHAEALGFTDGAPVADALLEAMIRQFWQGGSQGWARRVDHAGAVIDATPDLYDYAFVLFALGWRYRVRSDSQVRSLADQTLAILHSRFRHPSGAGFHASLPAQLPREQNPHMHLTEAALVWVEASQDIRFVSLANDLAGLFTAQICPAPHRILREFFSDDWTADPSARGQFVEPGHQFEWAWILAQHQRLTGANHAGVIAALVDWAETHGVEPATGLTFNRLRDDGAVLDRGSRTWPNTERIKGWIGHAEINGADPTAALTSSTQLLMSRYLAPAAAGCWWDAYDADGRPIVEAVPASTLYHLFLAFAELLRWSQQRRMP